MKLRKRRVRLTDYRLTDYRSKTQILYYYAPSRISSHKEICDYLLHQLDSCAIKHLFARAKTWKMKLRSRIGILRSVAMYYWKPFNKRRLKRFYSQFIKPGDLCFDIGAHLGNRTDAWLALGAKVVAVEPQPHCLNFMRQKFRNSKDVTIVPKAVAEKRGELTLHVSHATPTISTISDEKWRNQINSDAWYDVQWEEQVQVKAITLDDLIEQYGLPVFCKIDVENYEAEVLRGLSQPLPALSFEYYPPAIDSALECFDILGKLATYKYNYSFGESQRLQSDGWLSKEKMLKILSGFSLHKHYGDVYAIGCDTP